MLIIDRFEGNKAVIEDGDNHFELDRSRLPENASEGDVIVEKDGDYLIDHEQTQRRRRKIIKLQNSLWG
ncbi:MAG: DUF3006 domain-containing protein [Porcipelethomonas sp.]